MSSESEQQAARRERLSAFIDGEADGASGLEALRAWSDDGGVRRDWHAWQLIGDVLRSEDLASDPRGDVRFCAAVRVRLAAEPVVLAPRRLEPYVSAEAGAARRPGWGAVSSALAAGFVLVVGTFALFRPAPPAAPAPAIALADSASAIAPAASARSFVDATAQSVVDPSARLVVDPSAPLVVDASMRASAAPAESPAEANARVVADRQVVRDPELDRYLVAHKQFTGTSALGVPSTFLRSATIESRPR